MRPRTVRAAELPSDATWLNATRPLSFARDLRGHVVVLDFWTYCCINCMHVLPVLRRLEERFAAEPLVVIGVHSAKFISEKDPRNIRSAIERYGIKHPVIVDSEHDIWERFAVRAWPTLVLVDAEGYVRETLPGEAEDGPLAALVGSLLEEGRRAGTLAAAPLHVAPDPENDSTVLRFPGRILATADRLFVADSGHNRIVIAGHDGKILATVGEGGAGAHDGPGTEASFHNPQGMAVIGTTLYVADTGNHLIRAVDLETRLVKTVAGTSEMGRGPMRPDRGDPLSIPLRSPWGLLAAGRQLLIAMAGSHQIWVFDPHERRLGPYAGSGREDHTDGPIAQAAFAQPSGLAAAGKFILVADSEISSIRAIDLEEGAVKTIVGRGLFDFGDTDGAPEKTLLQHPLDVAVDTGVLYVADTYNNKIKAISFGSMHTRTVLGDGERATMHEPGGIAVAGGSLLIADTNNHRILRGDPKTGALEELVLKG
ncbi:MAG TPA: thioredoxin-like domain-containing protein [Candidatus Polarisedimenticolia bacterium]|nr:thioredoxin-like domain-containing protein [Candidatus Polarisedimenticolia bacterium]